MGVGANAVFNFGRIKILIGLGNPKPAYEKTYHNAGFLFADFTTRFLGSMEKEWKTKDSFAYRKAGALIVVKSLAFMNDSGRAVSAAARFFKAEPTQILVVHDDSDIAIGSFKISFGRGSAGHKGAASAIKYLKTKNFWRLRIGVRPTNEAERKKAGEFVLKKVSAANEKILNNVFRKVASGAGLTA